jgi:hypothetical protein
MLRGKKIEAIAPMPMLAQIQLNHQNTPKPQD